MGDSSRANCLVRAGEGGRSMNEVLHGPAGDLTRHDDAEEVSAESPPKAPDAVPEDVFRQGLKSDEEPCEEWKTVLANTGLLDGEESEDVAPPTGDRGLLSWCGATHETPEVVDEPAENQKSPIRKPQKMLLLDETNDVDTFIAVSEDITTPSSATAPAPSLLSIALCSNCGDCWGRSGQSGQEILATEA